MVLLNDAAIATPKRERNYTMKRLLSATLAGTLALSLVGGTSSEACSSVEIKAAVPSWGRPSISEIALFFAMTFNYCL